MNARFTQPRGQRAARASGPQDATGTAVDKQIVHRNLSRVVQINDTLSRAVRQSRLFFTNHAPSDNSLLLWNMQVSSEAERLAIHLSNLTVNC